MKDSEEAEQKKLQDRALVTLALGVTEKKTRPTLPVSDEDLISFYQNQLGDDRRSQLMNAIANDDSTYQRWIDLVQTTELADKLTQQTNEIAQESLEGQAESESSSKTIKLKETKNRNLFQALRSWLHNEHGWNKTIGIACTAALATVLITSLIPQIQQPTLDELFQQYAMSGSALLPEKSINLPSGTENKTYSTEQTEMAKGIISGFKELAADNLPPEWEIDLTRHSDTETNPDRGAESVYELGRLVALSLVQCKLANNNDYFKSAAPLMRKLAKKYDLFAHLVANSGSDRSDVCGTAKALIKLV